MCSLPLSEAEAVRVVRTWHAAKGRIATASQEAHAQRSTDSFFKKRKLSLPVQISSLDHVVRVGKESRITSHFVLPSEWLRCIVSSDISVLCGEQNPAASFRAFWEGFRLSNPDHKVFEVHSPEALTKVVPLLLHGDEGRGQKKSPYLVVSIESPIGCMARLKKACSCSAHMEARPDLAIFGEARDYLLTEKVKNACLKMFTNFRGHSYLTRHLVFGARAWVYKKNPHVLEELLDVIVDDFNQLMFRGIQIPGHPVMFAALAGCKGDMDWRLKMYNLNRCYSKVQSRDVGMICHACCAAAGANSIHNFDDFSEAPNWESTLYTSRPFENPWPRLAHLPINDDTPEKAIVGDTLHIIKLGIARDLVGGIIIVLLRRGFFDDEGSSKNLKDRLERAHSHFMLFCGATKEHPSLRGFTKDFFHIRNFLSAPSAPWANSKGSDSLILLRWCSFFTKLQMERPTVAGYGELLSCMLQIFRLIHSHRLFLERPCASLLYVSMMRVLRGYKKLGLLPLSMHIRAFILKPKTHALHHLAFSIKEALEAGHPIVLNPEAHACEMNEDLIGRVSRLSRRVGVRLMNKRVLERYFLKKRALMARREK